jgi:NADH:ubiquinone oxidoreductase subunit 2 (subunit N)
MQTGFPIVMLGGPIVAAIFAMIVRGRRRASLTVGLVAVALLTMLLALASPGAGLFSDNVMSILGREIVLTPFVRSLFLFLYPALGALFAVCWARPSGMAIAPLGLAAMAPLAGSLMITPAGLGVVPLMTAAALVVPVLHSGRFEAARSTWRFFLLVAFAAAFLLVVAAPPVAAGSALWAIPLLAALILFGGFPFQSWARGVSRTAPHSGLILVTGIVQIVVVVFVLQLFDSVPTVRAMPEFQQAIRWSIALSTMIAAFLLARATDWKQLLGGALLFDMGFLLAATLAPGADGMLLALPALISRFLSLCLIALSLGTIPSGAAQLPGRLSRWWPVAHRFVTLFALFSLIGLPLTPGFAGRWAQFAVIGQGEVSAILTAIAMLAAVFCIFRFATRAAGESSAAVAPASTGQAVLALVFLALALLAGLFPDFLMRLASGIVGL